MHTPKMSIAMATLVLALLAALSTATVALKRGRRNCNARCDYSDDVQYPFGIGPECSLPGFNLSCVVGADNTSYLLLGNNPSIKVYPDNLVNYSPLPAIAASIGYFVKMAAGSSGSSDMSLFVVGCGIKASLFVGDTDIEVGNCSVACVEDQIMETLPQGRCVGIGCCSIDIMVDLRPFTLNISRTGRAARLREQVNAFITHQNGYSFTSLDLEYDLSGSVSYLAALSWAIPDQPNCKRAM